MTMTFFMIHFQNVFHNHVQTLEKISVDFLLTPFVIDNHALPWSYDWMVTIYFMDNYAPTDVGIWQVVSTILSNVERRAFLLWSL